MPGPLYDYLKTSFGIHIQKDAEEIIQQVSRPTPNYQPIIPQPDHKFQHLMSSLLLLRCHDIYTTDKSLLYFVDGAMSDSTLQKLEEMSREGISKSHVLFSITTLPCRCPIVLECCSNMKLDNLNYVVVYQQDKDFLRKQDVNSITT